MNGRHRSYVACVQDGNTPWNVRNEPRASRLSHQSVSEFQLADPRLMRLGLNVQNLHAGQTLPPISLSLDSSLGQTLNSQTIRYSIFDIQRAVPHQQDQASDLQISCASLPKVLLACNRVNWSLFQVQVPFIYAYGSERKNSPAAVLSCKCRRA